MHLLRGNHMKKKFIILGILASILLAGIAYSQVSQGIQFPPTFSYTLPALPPEQSQNQIWLSKCPYKHPIELRDVKVYGSTTGLGGADINAQIRVWVDGRKAACAYSKTFHTGIVNTPSQLSTAFINSLNNEIIASANANTQPPTLPNPISTNS